MVDPAGILFIPGAMAALSDYADAIRAAGVGFAATGPVKAVAASAGEDMQSAAAAVTEYAAEVAAIRARLDDLQSRATALQRDVATATATAVYEGIRADPALDARESELSVSIADAVAAWEAAQQRCAAALRAVSSPSPLVGGAGVFQGSPFTALGQNPGETLRTPIGPRGPLTEIFPIEVGVLGAGGTGFTPLPAGPEILVNVPGRRCRRPLVPAGCSQRSARSLTGTAAQPATTAASNGRPRVSQSLPAYRRPAS